MLHGPDDAVTQMRTALRQSLSGTNPVFADHCDSRNGQDRVVKLYAWLPTHKGLQSFLVMADSEDTAPGTFGIYIEQEIAAGADWHLDYPWPRHHELHVLDAGEVVDTND